MRLDRTIDRFRNGPPEEWRRGARDIGHELSRNRLDVLRDLRANLAAIKLSNGSYFAGFRDAILEILASYEASVMDGTSYTHQQLQDIKKHIDRLHQHSLEKQ